jgi:SNF2 family DNA or RNA helicase
MVFYEIGYSIYTLRQASRRSWRIGQKRQVKIVYLYYKHTIQ